MAIEVARFEDQSSYTVDKLQHMLLATCVNVIIFVALNIEVGAVSVIVKTSKTFVPSSS